MIAGGGCNGAPHLEEDDDCCRLGGAASWWLLVRLIFICSRFGVFGYLLLFIFIFSDVTSERFSARFSLLLPLLSLAPLSTYLQVWYLSYVLPHHTLACR